MKSTELEKILKLMGYSLVRLNKHRVWSNGKHSAPVPHDKEINRMVARRILKEIGYQQDVPEVNYYAKASA
jgi:hypothetical protein